MSAKISASARKRTKNETPRKRWEGLMPVVVWIFLRMEMSERSLSMFVKIELTKGFS